jgi:hypothetical protein
MVPEAIRTGLRAYCSASSLRAGCEAGQSAGSGRTACSSHRVLDDGFRLQTDWVLEFGAEGD